MLQVVSFIFIVYNQEIDMQRGQALSGCSRSNSEREASGGISE